MTHLAPEKVAEYVTQSGQALALANETMQKAAAQERQLGLRAPEIADMLLAHGLISPGQKEAAIAQLANPENLQTILCNVLNKQASAPQTAAPAVPTAGRGVTTKAASAFGFGNDGHTSAPGPGEGDGSLFNPIVCGAPRTTSDPTMRRWSSSLFKLAGIQH